MKKRFIVTFKDVDLEDDSYMNADFLEFADAMNYVWNMHKDLGFNDFCIKIENQEEEDERF